MGRVCLDSRDAEVLGIVPMGRLPSRLGLSPVMGTREHTPPTARGESSPLPGGSPVTWETQTPVPMDGPSHRHTAGSSAGTAHPPCRGQKAPTIVCSFVTKKPVYMSLHRARGSLHL